MGHASSWKDPNTHITYKRGDKIVVTGTVQKSADGQSGTWGKVEKKTYYFYSHYTADWTVRAPICIGKSSGSAWAFVKADAIVSGGTKESYAINYDANGGSGAPTKQTKYYAESLTLRDGKPTRTGYKFVNWNTKKDGSGTPYNPGGTYKSNQASTLYAQWVKNTYPISYDANGGKGAPDDQTKTYGVDIKLRTGTPTKDGHVFSSWNTKKDGSGTKYDPGDTYATNSGLTLYAQWSAWNHTVKYDGNGGTGAPGPQTKTYGSTIKISNTIPTRTGYAFLSWNTKKDGTGTEYLPGQTYGYDQNGGAITLYAQWEIDNVCFVKTPAGFQCGVAYVRVNGKWVQGEHVYVRANKKWNLGIR